MEVIQAVQNINKSWLDYLGQAVTEGGERYIYEATEFKTSDGVPVEDADSFIVLSPFNEWQADTDKINLNFRIATYASQTPGETLKSFNRNMELQELVFSTLFAQQRKATGFSVSGSGLYTVPYFEFESDGTRSLKDSYGIEYAGGHIWRNVSPDGANAHVWAVEIPVSVNLGGY